MSILEVKNLSHGFGDRAIFEDVSFRLLKGEHIGLVGANGEGKSTFMSIVTGKMLPDEGKVEWSKYVTAGYLDQHSVLAERQSVRDVLRTAFDELSKLKLVSMTSIWKWLKTVRMLMLSWKKWENFKTVWRVVISIPWMLRLTK